MDLVSLESAVVWPHATEVNIFTQVVAAFSAEPAFLARDTGFDCYSVACFCWSVILLRHPFAFLPIHSWLCSFLTFHFLRPCSCLLVLYLCSCFLQFIPYTSMTFPVRYFFPNKTERQRERQKGKRESKAKGRLTNHKIFDSFSNLEHNTSSFMSQNTIAFHNQGSNASSLPEMDIRSITTSYQHRLSFQKQCHISSIAHSSSVVSFRGR